MRALERLKMVRKAVVFSALLTVTGTGWAAQGGSQGVPGDLDARRKSVAMSLNIPAYPGCGIADPNNPNLVSEYAVKAYIFQPSGRMFAIGNTEPPTAFQCDPAGNTVDVTINAFPGLSFKPGPATLMFQVIQTKGDGLNPASDTVIYEYGSRVNLH